MKTIDEDEDNRRVAERASLSGYVGDGATREEAVENIKEAIALCIEALKQEGLPAPVERFNMLLVAV